jgi:hypothetical protein
MKVSNTGFVEISFLEELIAPSNFLIINSTVIEVKLNPWISKPEV